MIDKVTIEITDKHINNAYNSNYNPLEIAVAESLNIDVDRVEVKRNKVYIWMYDDSDYALYKYDEESYVKVYDFLNEWQLVTNGYTDEDGAFPFEGDLISFNIEVDNDTGTHSNNWHGASLDFSGFADEFDEHKKNLKFRLTDDEY
tara:strand:- start:225 stop:662 length:438 start_codon:yes stop_codon:yes gene_type:complete